MNVSIEYFGVGLEEKGQTSYKRAKDTSTLKICALFFFKNNSLVSFREEKISRYAVSHTSKGEGLGNSKYNHTQKNWREKMCIRKHKTNKSI